MEEDTSLDVTGRGEFLRKGTTELNDFLPFGGKDITSPTSLFALNAQKPPIQVDSPYNKNETATIKKDYIQDNVVGIQPYSKDQLAKNQNDFAKSIISDLNNKAYSLEDNNQYSKSFMYDSTATGAHKAKYKAYGQKTFDKIGFSPLINNDEIFVNNTSIMDDFIRTAKNSFFPMVGQGLLANPKSYAKLIGGDIGQDYDQSDTYEEYSNIGYSTRGGPLAFVNNVFNSLGYSAGVMFEAGVEMALEGAIEGAIVGSIEPGAGNLAGGALGGAAGGAMGVLKGLAVLPKSLFNMGRYGGKMMSNLKNIEKFNEAKTLFNTAIKSTVNFVNPVNNTVTAYKQYDNLTGLARASRTAGGFFRDVIGINAALSEGRLEGGFVENKTYEKGYDGFWKEFNRAPDDKEQLELRKRAKIAGFQDTWKNTLLVYYSNKIAFPNLFGGKLFANMSRNVTKVGAEFDLIYKAAKKGVKEGSYELVDYNMKNALKGIIKPANFGKASLMYFKTNLIEGTQEVLQDVLADSTEQYYVGSYLDPTKANFDYSLSTLSNAFGHQVSKQGFETFMSGFVMGAFLKPLDIRVPRWATAQYNKWQMDPQEYKTYIDNRKNYGEQLKNAMNKTHQNPVDFLNDRSVNLGNQSIISKKLADDESDKKEIYDGQSAGFLSEVITMAQAGTFKVWLENFKKYSTMSDKDLEDSLDLQEGEGPKIRTAITEYVDKAKKVQQRYQYGQDTFGSKKMKLSNFKEGTPEYEKASIYNKAIDQAIYNLTFLGASFDDNLTRVNKIVKNLGSLKAIKNLPGADFNILVDHSRLTNNIKMLETEIESLKLTGSEEALKQAENKQELLNKLQKFQNTQIDYFTLEKTAEQLELRKQELKKSGDIEQSEIDTLDEFITKLRENSNPISAHREAFEDLLKTLSGSDVNYLQMMRELNNNEGFEALYKDLIDVYKLTLENKNLSQYISTLTDPGGFYQHVDRNFEWMRNMWLNRQNYYKEVIDRSIKMKENNDLLKSLADQNIYVDLDQFAEWTENPNKLPEYFIDATKDFERIIPRGSVAYDKYIGILINVADVQKERAAGDPVDITGQLDEAIKDLMDKKSNELDQAELNFKEDLKTETGFSYDDLKKLEQEAKEKSQNIENETLTNTQLKNLKKEVFDIFESLPADDPAGIEKILTDFINSKKIPDSVLNFERLNEFIDEFMTNPSEDNMLGLSEEKMNSIKKDAIDLYKEFPSTYDNDQRKYASTLYFAVSEFVNDYFNNVQVSTSKQKQEKQDEGPQYIVIEDTQSYKDYQLEIENIENRYAQFLEELKQSFAKRGATTSTPEGTDQELSTKTSWSEIEQKYPVLYKILNDKFKEDVVDDLNISEADQNFEAIRNNWLEQQSETINKYKIDLEVEKEIKKQESKKFKAPVFKFFILPEELKEITPSSNINDINIILDALKNMVATKIYVNPKTKKSRKLTDQEIIDIKSDIIEVDKLIYWLRQNKVVEDQSLFDQTYDVYQEKVQNRKNEIEEIRDENGILIERRIDGKVANRVTKEAEKLDLELTPGKKPFSYNVLDEKNKKQYDEEGNLLQEYTVPSPIMSAYDAIVESDSIEDSKKLDSFITSFATWAMNSKINVFKDGSNKKLNTEKFRLLRESLEKDFSRENVYKTITELAFKHLADSGNLIDDLTKDFLTREGTSFKKITRPENMSQKAFSNLYGKNGIITKFRDSIIDGNFIVVGASDLVFDKTLFENGLVGETDLVAINPDGDIRIIDIKALKSDSWNIFDSDIKLAKLKSKLKSEGLSEDQINNDAEIVKLQEGVMRSKKQYFRIQQSIYRNLIYRMTGIKPKRIGLLAIETDVDNEGNILNAGPANILPVGESTLELEYFPEVERIVPLPEITSENIPKGSAILIEEPQGSKLLADNIGKKVIYNGQIGTLEFNNGYYIKPIESTPVSTDTKADVERRYGEEIKIALNEEINDSFAPVKVGPKNESRSVTEAILNATNFLKETFNWPQVEISVNSEENSFTFIVNGTEFKVDGSIGFSSINGVTTVSLPFRLKDIVNEKYQAELDALGITDTEAVAIYLNKEGKEVMNGTLTLQEVGISPVSIIKNIGQIVDVNGKRINAEILGSNKARINNVYYTLNKNRKGQISSMTYGINDAEIFDLNENISIYESEVSRLQNENTEILSPVKIENYKQKIEAASEEEKIKLQNELKDLQEKQSSNIMQIGSYNNQIDQLKLKIQGLETENVKIKLTGGNLNDFIFALNALPENAILYKGKSKQDQKNDLGNIDNKSNSPNTSKKVTEIMERNFPNAVNKLIEQGLNSISQDELSSIKNWINSTMEELSTLRNAIAIKKELTTPVDNQINVLNNLLNDIELIKLNKDGRISKSNKTAEKLFGPGRVSDRTGLPKNEIPPVGSAEGVPIGKGTGTGRKGTVNQALNRVKQKQGLSSILSGIDIPTVKSTKEADKLIDNIKNAKSATELKNAYFEALAYLQNNPGKIDPNKINNAYKSSEPKFANEEGEILIDIIKEGMYLLPKQKMFGNKDVSPVLVIKKTDKVITIKDVNTNKSKQIKPEELSKFVTMDQNGINKIAAPELTKEEIQEIQENSKLISDAFKDITALDERAAAVQNSKTKGSFRNELKEKVCNKKESL